MKVRDWTCGCGHRYTKEVTLSEETTNLTGETTAWCPNCGKRPLMGSPVREASREEALRVRYGASEHGNYYVADIIGVPHPYCITRKHIEHCDSVVLDAYAIREAEKHGAKCGIPRCNLSFDQHEQALLVKCKAEIKGEDGQAMPELRDYLLKCKPLCEADKYAGFAFMEDKA